MDEDRLVKELDKIDGKIEKLQDSVVELKVDLSSLKAKSGVWGLLGGSMAFLLAWAVQVTLK